MYIGVQHKDGTHHVHGLVPWLKAPLNDDEVEWVLLLDLERMMVWARRNVELAPRRAVDERKLAAMVKSCTRFDHLQGERADRRS